MNMSVFFYDNSIALGSLIIAIIALLLNRKLSKLNSYSQKGNYIVYFQERNFVKKLLGHYSFQVKIDSSIFSEKINFDYDLKIGTMLGGIYRTQVFEDIGNHNYIGTDRTKPVVRNYKNKLPKKYASQEIYRFSSSPWFPYFSINGTYNEDKRYWNNRLTRYHRYIEITDYCGNTEIWYLSFSLILTNVEENSYGWKAFNNEKHFSYYKFDDFNIVSPQDIFKNLKRANLFDKDLKDISGESNSDQYNNLIKHGYNHINADLELFEMKEYINFIKKVKEVS